MVEVFRFGDVELPAGLRPGDTLPVGDGVKAILLAEPAPVASWGSPLRHGLLPQMRRDFTNPVAPAIYAGVVEVGSLVGQRTILAGARFFNDVSFQYRQLGGVAGKTYAEVFPVEFKKERHLRQHGDVLEVSLLRVARDALPKRSLLVSSTESMNFGSWIFRILPKLVVRNSPLFQKALSGYGAHVVAPADRPWKADLLARGAPDAQIVAQDANVIHELSDAAFLSQPVRNGMFPRWILDAVQAFVPERHAGAAGAKRIYVSRRKWSAIRKTRVLLNEAEVEALLAERGFTIVHPEENDLAANAGLFAGADVVVGPSGAGMFNAIFCRSGTIVLEIEQSMSWRWTHANVYRSAGLQFGFIDNTGNRLQPNPAGHDSYWTDISRLKAVLDDLLDTF